ncbi:hypothetical protein TrRE_jg2133, partial [Triparma retinervis]
MMEDNKPAAMAAESSRGTTCATRQMAASFWKLQEYGIDILMGDDGATADRFKDQDMEEEAHGHKGDGYQRGDGGGKYPEGMLER